MLVPIQQAELFLDKLKSAGVETKLVVKKGAAHGWGDLLKTDVPIIADWFDAHLKAPKKDAANTGPLQEPARRSTPGSPDRESQAVAHRVRRRSAPKRAVSS